MTRYLPARFYLWMGLGALALAGFSAWIAWGWLPGAIPAALFLLTSVLLMGMALLPPIEIHDGYLGLGRRAVPWIDIRRVDRLGWAAPLVLRLTLFDDSRVVLIYPGDLDACNSLVRHVRRLSRDALIDGIPYRQYWGELLLPGGDRKQLPAARFRVLRPEDEAEVERLYQRLKTVGNLDQKKADEK